MGICGKLRQAVDEYLLRVCSVLGSTVARHPKLPPAILSSGFGSWVSCCCFMGNPYISCDRAFGLGLSMTAVLFLSKLPPTRFAMILSWYRRKILTVGFSNLTEINLPSCLLSCISASRV